MKAYLIDPFARNISTIETDASDDAQRSLIGCAFVTRTRLDEHNDIGVDDCGFDEPRDGQCAQRGQQYFILLGERFQLLAGKGVVIGQDGIGGRCDTSATTAQLWSRISWPKDPDIAADIAERLRDICIEWYRTRADEHGGAKDHDTGGRLRFL
jgi:hypothetical protein